MTSALGGGGVSQKKMYKEGLNRFYTIGQCQMRTREVKKVQKCCGWQISIAPSPRMLLDFLAGRTDNIFLESTI